MTQKLKEIDAGWIKEIPVDWNLKKVKEVYEFVSVKVSDTEYPALTVSSKYGITPQMEHVAKTLNGDSRKRVERGNFVINSRADRPGACGISNYDGSVSMICHVLKPRNNKVLHEKYMHYLFRNSMFSQEFSRWGRGIVSDLWSTRKDEFGSLQLPIPPLKDQEVIGKYLELKEESLNNMIDLKENQLDKLNEQRQSIITEAVTKGLNPNVKLKDSGVEWIGEIPEHWALNKIKYCVNLLGEKAEEQTTLQYLGLENIESKTGRYIPTEDVDIDGSAIKFFKGNVLFGKLRPYLTKVLLAEFNGRCSTEILVLETLSSIINNAYLKSLLLTPNFIDEINSSTYGSKMPRANWSFIGNTLIPLPPLSEQEVIVKEIMEVDERYFILISKLKNQIEKLKEYRQALIYEAVTGKIDVRDMELDEVR